MSHRVVRGFEVARLRRLRLRAGLSMAEVGRLAEVAPATIAGWERNNGSPDITRLMKVARLFDVDIGYLVRVPVRRRMPSDWRVLTGMTQIELAKKVGLSTASVASFERAEQQWNTANAKKIARALGMPVDELHRAWNRARKRPPGSPA